MTRNPFQTVVRATIIVVAVANALFVVWAILASFDLTPLSVTPPERRIGRITGHLQGVLGAGFGVLGAFLAARCRWHRGTMVLAGYVVAQGLATGYLLYIRFVGVSGDAFLIARALVNWLAYALAIRTTQLFPRTLEVSDRAATLVGRPARLLGAPVFRALGPFRVWGLTLVLLALSLLIRREIVFHVGQLTVIALVIATMTVNYRAGGLEDRRKIYWLLVGASCLLLGRLVIAAAQVTVAWSGASTAGGLGLIRPAIWTVANLGLMTSLLVAVFFAGAVDPRLVLKRTAAYSLGAGLVLFTFAAFENFLSDAVANLLGVQSGLIGILVGAAIALLFKPLFDLFSTFAERTLPKTSPPDRPTAPGPATIAGETE